MPKTVPIAHSLHLSWNGQVDRWNSQNIRWEDFPAEVIDSLKKGEKVFNENITLFQNSHYEDEMAPFFDAEGVLKSSFPRGTRGVFGACFQSPACAGSDRFLRPNSSTLTGPWHVDD